MTHTEKKEERNVDIISKPYSGGRKSERKIRELNISIFAFPPHSRVYLVLITGTEKCFYHFALARRRCYLSHSGCRHHCAGWKSFELIFTFFFPPTLTVDDDFIFILTILKFIFHSCRVARRTVAEGSKRKFRTINSRVEWR